MTSQERVQYIYDLTKCAIIDIHNGRLAPNAILTIMQDIQAEMIALGARTPTTATEVLFNGGNSTGQASERGGVMSDALIKIMNLPVAGFDNDGEETVNREAAAEIVRESQVKYAAHSGEGEKR